MSSKLINLIEKVNSNGQTIESLAIIAGCTKGTLSKFKNEPDRELDSFEGLVKLVKHLDAKSEFDIMIDYSKSIKASKKTARYMLEYLDTNKLANEKNELIDRMEASVNKESQLWAKLYKLDQMVVDKKISPFVAIQSLTEAGGKIENKIAACIFSAYIYLDLKLYDQVLNVVDGALGRITGFTESYIENMYKTRLHLLKAEALNRSNRVEEAREHCMEIINNSVSDTYKGWAYIQLGNSYILTDYNKALNLFSTGLSAECLSEIVYLNLTRSHNFLNNVWDKERIYLNVNSEFVSDIHELAFDRINKQQFEEATKLLDSVDKENCSHNELAFHYYQRGLISNEMKDFTKSISYFNKSGDIYFKQLPILKLKKMNVHDSIIELLSE